MSFHEPPLLPTFPARSRYFLPSLPVRLIYGYKELSKRDGRTPYLSMNNFFAPPDFLYYRRRRRAHFMICFFFFELCQRCDKMSGIN